MQDPHVHRTRKNNGDASGPGSEGAGRIILGIDPGTTIMGYGIVHAIGPNVTFVDAGCVRFTRDDDQTLRLREVFRRTTALIAEHLPDEMAIEAQFFGKNVQSMLKLGRAQGVAIAAAIQRDVPVVEYAPKRIKQSVTGNGNATKEQVAAMLQGILDTGGASLGTDATDALAVALCHHYARNGHATASRKGGDWGAFVRNNPGRVR
ncbi:MAG: crossover junction endodeoxyribonuclease RuvC [Flavobacteriales bacterium]|nr:crossover junction endodeoxyribonuclease RuvC [Flavobacteriales bacterium]